MRENVWRMSYNRLSLWRDTMSQLIGGLTLKMDEL